ncbi:hypothetical protein ACFQU7_41220 [Pseudoroseomonas wenyumeiae]
MPLQQHDNGAEPGLLQARSQQDGGVEAGTEPLLQDLPRRPDALPDLLKRGGRVDVANVQRTGGAPDRLRLLIGALLVAALVALKLSTLPAARSMSDAVRRIRATAGSFGSTKAARMSGI